MRCFSTVIGWFQCILFVIALQKCDWLSSNASRCQANQISLNISLSAFYVFMKKVYCPTPKCYCHSILPCAINQYELCSKFMQILEPRGWWIFGVREMVAPMFCICKILLKWYFDTYSRFFQMKTWYILYYWNRTCRITF